VSKANTEGRWSLDLDVWIMGISIEALSFFERLSDDVYLSSIHYDVLQPGKVDLPNDVLEATTRRFYAGHMSTPTIQFPVGFEKL